MITGLKTPSWDDVLSTLRGGEYPQGRGAMAKRIPLADAETGITWQVAYCPLGIINHLAKADWQMLCEDAPYLYCDENGETEVPDRDVLAGLGLTQLINAAEIEETPYGPSFLFMHETTPERWELIAYLNDVMLWSFEAIAYEIERLGWNVT